MPHLDIDEFENYVHLVQLFMSAHPKYRQQNEQVRAHTGMPDEYFLSMSMTREMAQWARKKHLVTRAQAEALMYSTRLVEADTDPSDIELSMRVMGTPPRLQPSISSVDIYRWLYVEDLQLAPGDEIHIFTLPAATMILEDIIAKAGSADNITAIRAQKLIDYLKTQQTATQEE